MVGFSVENLSELVPELLDKLRVIEKKPVNNVTTNIMRIRELIAQARSVAMKVNIITYHHQWKALYSLVLL